MLEFVRVINFLLFLLIIIILLVLTFCSVSYSDVSVDNVSTHSAMSAVSRDLQQTSVPRDSRQHLTPLKVRLSSFTFMSIAIIASLVFSELSLLRGG